MLTVRDLEARLRYWRNSGLQAVALQTARDVRQMLDAASEACRLSKDAMHHYDLLARAAADACRSLGLEVDDQGWDAWRLRRRIAAMQRILGVPIHQGV